MKIINFEKNKIIPLTIKEYESNLNQGNCHISKKNFEYKHTTDNNYCKVIDYYHYTRKYRGAAHSICNLKYSVPKEISVVFHNRSNYYHNFIIKERAKEFEGELNCLEENTES